MACKYDMANARCQAFYFHRRSCCYMT